MWTVRNTVGKLVEARLTTGDEAAVVECLLAISHLVARAEVPVVGIFDLARVRVLGKETQEHLLGVMRGDNPRVERTAIVVRSDALLEMQMDRLIRAASMPHRQVFRARNEALLWLAECLSATELARARAFLNEER